MTRPTPRRPVAAVIALVAFLSGSVGTVLGAHRCPHHDGDVPPAMADATGAHDPHQHGAAEDEHRSCTCLGTCHGAVEVAAPGGGPLARDVAPPAGPSPVPVTTAADRVHTPYLLPFANAPPRR